MNVSCYVMDVAVAQVRFMDLRLFASTSTNSSPPSLPTSQFLRYANSMLDEKDFQRKADAAFDDLKRRLLTVGDEHGFDVEGESGKLEVIFEEPEEAKFVVSPNTPVREIWISALSTSFKLGWSDSKNTFVSEKTGENLLEVMSRVVSQQLGATVKL
jgi:iron donor protein CyaY